MAAAVKAMNDRDVQRRMFPDVAERILIAAAVRQREFFQSVRPELRPTDFQIVRHVELWSACGRVADSGSDVNISTLALDLAEHGTPAGCDISYLTDLDRDYVEVTDPRPFVEAIRAASRNRRALALATKMRAEIELQGYDPQRVRAALEDLERMEAEAGDGCEVERLPDVMGLARLQIEWVHQGEIAVGAVTAVVSPGGHGKSTLALYRAVEAAMGGRDVLYLDGENPSEVVIERLARFNLTQTPERLKIWGGWVNETPDPADPRILSWAKAHPGALVIVDPLISFLARLGLDENSAVDVRRWFAGPRALAHCGAAVEVLVHAIKNGQGFRGSGDIRNACDVMFDLENPDPGGDIRHLTLRATKRRISADQYIPLVWDAHECGFRRRLLTKAETNTEICERVLRANPGCTKNGFTDMATEAGAPWHRSREFLDSGVAAGTIRAEKAGRGSKYYWLGEPDAE